MASRLPVINVDGEVGDLSNVNSSLFKPAGEVLPPSLMKKLGVRGAQKAPTKERITVRLSPDIVQTFRATGKGWQARLDAALRDWLKTHPPA
jgi:uncharacterized protein (DUF4415 family)